MKYYIHEGTVQKGPYDLYELKGLAIRRDTPVWYEGLDKWTTAGEVEELKSLFAAPPVFNSSNPPALNNPKSRSGNKSKKRVIIVAAIVLVLTLLLVMILNNPNAVPGVRVELNTPKPTVVTSRADGDKSGLFNARTTVYATVQNQGGAGNVYVTFYITQGKKKWDKGKSVFLSANESTNIEMTFEEVTHFGGDITYRVEARAQ